MDILPSQYNELIQPKRSIQYYKIKTFCLTFFAYASIHCTRSSWSESKSDFRQSTGLSKGYTGWVDFAFLQSYALGLITLGHNGDRYNIKNFMVLGMAGVALFQLVFGLMGFSSDSSITQYLFPIFFAISGFCECSCWPGACGTMGNWFGKGKRGLIITFWTGCKNFGDTFGFLIMGVAILHNTTQWEFCFVLSSSVLFLMAILNFFLLDPYPKQVGYNLAENDGEEDHVYKEAIEEDQEQEEKKDDIFKPGEKINFLNAWRIPRVPLYAVAFMGLKSTQYGLLFWLPQYLSSLDCPGCIPVCETLGQINCCPQPINLKLNPECCPGSSTFCSLHSQQPYISAMFPIGSWIGGVLAGLISDKIGGRAIVMCPMLLTSAILMFIVANLGNSSGPYFPMILIVGMFLGGPYNLVAAACSMDLAKQPCLANKPKGLSTVASLMEASAVTIAAYFQLIIGYIPNNADFYLFSGLCLVTCMVIYPLALGDWHIIQTIKHLNKTQNSKIVQKEESFESNEQ